VADEDLLQKIVLSTIELVNNALEHGNKNNHEKSVYLAYMCYEHEVKVTVRDEGVGFDPSIIEDPRRDGKNQLERGRGIFIIKSYMDDLYFNEKGNTITITKSL